MGRALRIGATSSFDGYAELPRLTVDTSLPNLGSPSGAVTVANLQAAINAASPGATIWVDHTSSGAANISLPNKGGSSYIYIVSDALASLPASGGRATSADASNMPTITSTGSPSIALSTQSGACYYRFIGIKFAGASGATGGIIRIGSGESSASNLPHHIIIDRCLVQAHSTGGQRGIAGNGNYIAVIDSSVWGWVSTSAETQAFHCYNGEGPILLENNYFEASGENIFFGGQDPAITNLIPSDITITNNHIKKLLTWCPFDASYAGTTYAVKNLMESKNSRRVLVEKNLFENMWQGAQSYAINIKSANQDGTAAWCNTRDFTVRYNKFANVSNFCALAAVDDNPNVTHTNRVTLRGNMAQICALGNAGEYGRGFQVLGSVTYITIKNNTVVPMSGVTGTDVSFYLEDTDGGGIITPFDLTDNILAAGPQACVDGPGAAEGTATLNLQCGTYDCTENAIAASSGTYPATNIKPANIAAILFTNYAGLDWTLQAGSPCKGTGTGGADMGCNAALVEAYADTAESG